MAPDDQELRVAAPTQEGLRRSTAFGDFGDGHVGILVPPSGEAFREDGLLCGGDRVGGDGAVEGADAGRNPRLPRMDGYDRRPDKRGELERLAHGGGTAFAVVHPDDDGPRAPRLGSFRAIP